MNREELKELLIKNSKNIKRTPSINQMAKNVVQTAVDTVKTVAAGNSFNMTQDVINKRKEICNSCEFYNKNQDRCTKCGCFMAIKTYLRAATCPLGKW
jgi:hypothetical protein